VEGIVLNSGDQRRKERFESFDELCANTEAKMQHFLLAFCKSRENNQICQFKSNFSGHMRGNVVTPD
jgi:hypothetical protein